jgi:hypothetical protein
MKYKLKIYIIVVLISFQPKVFFGQLNISSNIVEETTKHPIPYVNIWIKNANIGTTSNENGFFLLKIDSNNINKFIVISSIGYVDTSILINKLNAEIQLKKKVYELPEITIFPKKRNELIINDLSKTKLNGAILNDTTPQIVGRYFCHEKKNSIYKYVKSVTIYSRDIHKGKLNLRLYSFDTTRIIPIEELLHNNIIIETKLSLFAKPKPIEIDLSKLNIIFPDAGLLICIEWLIIPENQYNMSFTNTDSKKKKTITMYAPHLCATIDKEGFVYQYKNGCWSRPTKYKKIPGSILSESYFNPAISLKLTD